jgi:hypothetical protein
MSLLSEERDLRPATFIRDIELKSRRLEEEKVLYQSKKFDGSSGSTPSKQRYKADGFDELMQSHSQHH